MSLRPLCAVEPLALSNQSGNQKHALIGYIYSRYTEQIFQITPTSKTPEECDGMQDRRVPLKLR